MQDTIKNDSGECKTLGAGITLYNDDCIKALEKVSDKSVDLILTDPPYNIGNFMKGRNANLTNMRENFFVSAGWDNLGLSEWEEMMGELFRQLARVSKIGGSCLMFTDIKKIEAVESLAEKNGFYYKTTGIWHKTNPMPRNLNLHFVNSVEPWLYFVYKTKTGTFNNDGKCLHDFIESPVAPKSERRYGKHPTQKPEQVMEHFVKVLSNDGDTILDPFMGSGTTGVVSKRLNRNFIGVELNKTYFEMAGKRIGEEETQINLFGD